MPKPITYKILSLAFSSLFCLSFVPSSLADGTPANVISKVKGNVLLKRNQWNNFRPVQVNDRVGPGDQLQLDNNASAVVFCENSNVWVVPAGKVSSVSQGCPPVDSKSNSLIATRGDYFKENFPYIISPRKTAVLNERPLLRWNPVSGATSYIVEITGGDLDWQLETSSTEIPYSGDSPLQPGVSYQLRVKIAGCESNCFEIIPGVDLKFRVLAQKEAEEVQAKIALIKQQNLTKEAEALALVNLYRNYELNAEAIQLLEGLIQQGTQTTTVYQLLGDLYLKTLVPSLAKQPYLKAWELAQKSEDKEAQAAIEVALAQVEYNLNNKDGVWQWFEKAQASYTALGNTEQLQELDKLKLFFSSNF